MGHSASFVSFPTGARPWEVQRHPCREPSLAPSTSYTCLQETFGIDSHSFLLRVGG